MRREHCEEMIRRVCVMLALFLMGATLLAGDVRAQQDPPENATTAENDQDNAFLWEEEEAEPVISDPIEPFNRSMFWVNDKLYFYLLKPVARAYRVVPEPARESVGRFFSNLGAPVRFLNAVLQFKLKAAGHELGRFALNSTVGFLGFFDPGREAGLHSHDEDFGQTLGHYGVGTGFYLVLPVFGPSNLRDGVGRMADTLVAPVSSPYYLELRQAEQIGVNAYERINALSLDKDTYEGIKRDALDPYLFVRNAYSQHRAAKVKE